MKSDDRRVIWGLGLSVESQGVLGQNIDPEIELKSWPENNLPAACDFEEDDPLLIWMSSRAWSEITSMDKAPLFLSDGPDRVLVLEREQSGRELEMECESGFSAIIRPPFSGKKVRELVERSIEARRLFGDILRMAQEISLERELLARKNEQLSFINRFIARTSRSLDPSAILGNARGDLSMLLPVSNLLAAVWSERGGGRMEAELFIPSNLENEAREEWIELLAKSVGKISGRGLSDFKLTPVPAEARSGDGPGEGRVMVMPLKSNGVPFGCVLLGADTPYSLGRDQVEILHSALNHLALVMNNAQTFNEIKTEADHDGLTRIYNRGFFETRLNQEVLRSQRYDQDLSLIMLDLDHFKRVNDLHGHQAGDAVLRKVGRLILDTARGTDMPARYGGEEFALILPHTNEAQAMILAERLRRLISEQTHGENGSVFRMTASIGVSSILPGETKSADDLVREADQALYLAKAAGRNLVSSASPVQAAGMAQ